MEYLTEEQYDDVAERLRLTTSLFLAEFITSLELCGISSETISYALLRIIENLKEKNNGYEERD